MSIGKLYKKLLIGIIVIFVFINCILMNGASQEESLFVLRILNSDIKIQNSYLKIEEIGKHWGTGFFVNFKDNLYIITAKHVAGSKYNLTGIARIKNSKTGEIETYKVFLPKDNWSYHPEDGNTNNWPVDVAVMEVKKPEGHKVLALDVYSDFLDKKYIGELLYKEFLKEPYICRSYNWLSDYMVEDFMRFDPTRPMPTFITNILDRKKVLKQGRIAKAEKYKVSNNKYFEDEVIILEGNMYPGNSGAPVIEIFPLEEPSRKLLGIHIASQPDRKINNIVPPKILVIEPSYRVIETLEYAMANPRKGTSIYWEPLKEEEY